MKKPPTVTVNISGTLFRIPQRWIEKRICEPAHKYKSRPRARNDAMMEWISANLKKGTTKGKKGSKL